jgi:hypothetical protein
MPKKFDFRPENFDANHRDESYAHWMRECFIHRLNEVIGWVEGAEKTGTATDFFNAQLDVQKIRQRTTHVYHAMVREKSDKCPPLWTFGAAFHQHYVEEKNDYKKVLAYHQNKLFATAQRIHNKFIADQAKKQKEVRTSAESETNTEETSE